MLFIRTVFFFFFFLMIFVIFFEYYIEYLDVIHCHRDDNCIEYFNHLQQFLIEKCDLHHVEVLIVLYMMQSLSLNC